MQPVDCRTSGNLELLGYIVGFDLAILPESNLHDETLLDFLQLILIAAVQCVIPRPPVTDSLHDGTLAALGLMLNLPSGKTEHQPAGKYQIVLP
jgi:hypothetical protein